MKIGLISDIHANIQALEAVLKHLKDEGAEKFICSGDIVGIGADPNSVCETLRREEVLSVAGTMMKP